MKKKYKALMLDLDGTTVPNERHGMPSDKVITAVQKASETMHIVAVTGRPYAYAFDIIDALRLKGPSIFSGGAQIVDPTKEKVLWQQSIPTEDVGSIITIIQRHKYATWIQDTKFKSSDLILDGQTNYTPTEVICMSVNDLTPTQAEELIEELSILPMLTSHKIVGWNKGTITLQLAHSEATKQHGILEISKLLHIEPAGIIGVGDGYNDYPFLMACGLKVAMGNAVPELKAIADYIAPSVDDDGVAHVIEKFVL